MREILRTSQFKRDVKKLQRSGKNTDCLRTVISTLARGQNLPVKHRDHQLKGIFRDCRECHVEPDLLLIYRIETNVLHLVRTGSHSDLFE